MISIHKLSKTFGRVSAVKQMDFTAFRGEIFGLLGPNGAGKTTTLRMIYGLIKPSSGNILVDDIDVAESPRKCQAKMGVLADGGSLYTRLTARENIQYFAQLHGMNKATFEQRLEEYVSILDMSNIINRKTIGFSQGERMKVGLTRALIHDPNYILLDEPTNGLDVVTTRAVRQLLLHLKSQNKCVIFSSHLMHEVNHLCDRIGIVKNGQVVIHGNIPHIIESAKCDNLEDAFVHFAYAEDGKHSNYA